MIVKQEMIREWKSLKDHGDMKTLVEETGHAHSTLKAAFEGRASHEVINAINKFYMRRKAQMEEASKQLINPVI